MAQAENSDALPDQEEEVSPAQLRYLALKRFLGVGSESFCRSRDRMEETPMGSSVVRRLVGFRVWGWMGIGLVVGGTAWGQAPARAPRGFVPQPGRAPLTPLPALRFTAVPGVPQTYDACLVATPAIDPQFAVQAPQVDEQMIVPARVTGLYRGTLAPRR